MLPPIARLTRDQAMYHFISGYTAKLAGTEVGVKEPTATFSTCFGAPFMPRHPGVYAEMLGERLDRHDVPVWLVNTGWTRRRRTAPGERMNITHTRQMVRAALNGALDDVADADRPDLRLRGAHGTCPDVPTEVLWPRDTWADKAAYDAQARKLASMFVENFKPVRGRRQRGDPRGGTAPGLIRTKFDSQGALENLSVNRTSSTRGTNTSNSPVVGAMANAAMASSSSPNT